MDIPRLSDANWIVVAFVVQIEINFGCILDARQVFSNN